MALTKADFATQLLDELGLSKPMAKDLVELFFEEIKATWNTPNPSKYPASVNSRLRDKVARPAGIRKPARKSHHCPTCCHIQTGPRLKQQIGLMP